MGAACSHEAIERWASRRRRSWRDCDPGTLRIGGGLAAAWGETLLDGDPQTSLSERVLPDVAAATGVERATARRAPLLGWSGLARSAR